MSVVQDSIPPQYYPVWWERFETPGSHPQEGLDEPWDQNYETPGPQAIFDTDAAPPTGAPASWGAACLHCDGVGKALVRHKGLQPIRHGKVTFQFYLDDLSGLSPGGASVSIARIHAPGDTETATKTLFWLHFSRDALGFINARVRVMPDGGADTLGLPSVKLQTFHTIEFYWNLDDMEWHVLLDGKLDNLFLQGAISGPPITEGWTIAELELGRSEGGNGVSPISIYMDDFKVEAFGDPVATLRTREDDADVVGADIVPAEDVAILTEHTRAIAAAGTAYGEFPIVARGSPSAQAHTFTVPEGAVPGYLHAATFHMSRHERCGPLVSRLYRVAGTPSIPIGAPLAFSLPVDDSILASGDNYEDVYFLFEESFLLVPGQYAVDVGSAAIGPSAYHASVFGLPKGAQVTSHPGHGAQLTSTVWTALSGGNVNLMFSVRTRPYAKVPGASPGEVVQVPDPVTPPPEPDAVHLLRTSDLGRLQERMVLTQPDRSGPVVARELLVSSEIIGDSSPDTPISQSFDAREAGEILDAVTVEEIDHDIEPTCGEEAHLLDTVLVLAGVNNGLDVIALELIEGNEKISDFLSAPRVTESGLLLTRVNVEVAANGVDVVARELAAGAEDILGGVTMPEVTEAALLLDRVAIEVAANGVDVVARELAAGAEDILDGTVMPVVEEEGLLLDRVLIEASSFDGLDILARETLLGAEEQGPHHGFPLVRETSRLADRVTVEASTFDGVDILARELMATLEDQLLHKGRPHVRGIGRLLDRVTVVATERNVDVIGRDLIRAVEDASPFRWFGADEGGRLLETAIVVQMDRLAVITAREHGSVVEIINTSVTPVVPQVVSGDAEVGFPFGPVGGARCTFATGVAAQSVAVEYQVNGGPWTFFHIVNVQPNTSGYASAWYQNTGGERIQFRLRPYSGDDLTGTEGPLFTTLAVDIPGGGEGG